MDPHPALSDRDERLARSRAFADALSAPQATVEGDSRAGGAGAQPARVGQATGPGAAARAARLDAELAARLDSLRLMSEPRTELPPALARFALLRRPAIVRRLLRTFNYLSRPSRTQAMLISECIELIAAELQRNSAHDAAD